MKSSLKKYRILISSLFLLILFLFVKNLSGLHIGKSGTPSFQDFCSDFFYNELSGNTLNLHFTLKEPKSAGISSYRVSLGNISANTPKQSSKELKRVQKQLNKYSRTFLNEEDKLTYDLLNDYIERQLNLAAYPYYDEYLSPSGGTTSQLPILLAEYEFRTKQDIDDYLTLLSQMDSYFSGILSYEQKKADEGLFMSDKICMKVMESCEVFTENPDDNFLVTTFSNRINALHGLSDSEKKEYISRNQTVISEHVIPAYRQMLSGLTQLLGRGQNDWGLCNFEKGRTYYEALTAYYTGTDDGIESINKQITNTRKKDLDICSKLLAKHPELITEKPKLDNALIDEKSMIQALKSAIKNDFPTPPETKCKILHVDPSLSEFLAPAFYITAPIDDYSVNKIYINNASDYDALYYFTTLAHEGYPGHLYQTVQSYHYGLAPVHYLLNYPGYTEGWATYVEMLAFYYSGVENNLASLLQHNQAVTLSLYATSDIGIHYYGWKEKEMEKFWSDYGITDKDSIQSITQLILEEPGNYLKYYVGYMKFRQLRELCEKKGGDSFHPVSFHEKILQTGPAPFDLLEKRLTK